MYIMCLFIFEEKVEILDLNTLSLNPDQKVDDPILGSRWKYWAITVWLWLANEFFKPMTMHDNLNIFEKKYELRLNLSDKILEDIKTIAK